MRKIILLLSAFFTFIITQSQAQSPTTLFSEDFDGATINLTTGNVGAGPFHDWHDTTGIYTSANKAYHTKGLSGQTETYFETPSFSTVGNPFVLLNFNHICKFYLANQGFLQISTDGGSTWTPIDDSTSLYLGGDQIFPQTDYFNASNHNPAWLPSQTLAQPDSTWYIKETFDLTGLASDTTGGTFTGYPNVKLRFRAVFNAPDVNTNNKFSAGWFIDDLEITGAPCELSPPTVSFDFNPQNGHPKFNCYVAKPTGGQLERTPNDYPIGVKAFDNSSPYDQGIDSLAAVYRINRGPWDTVSMPFRTSTSSEYLAEVPNVNLGDTVDYYVLAWDLSCLSNMTRNPELFQNGGFYTFWIDSAPPVKCGAPNCNANPNIILVTDSTEWVEDFDSPEWQAGTGTPPNHRGTFPPYLPYRWSLTPNITNQYGWSVNSGPTNTLYTGPNGDHTTGTGNYVYLESSFTNSANPAASISSFTTPCIDLTRVNGCYGLEFYYHMFGDDIDLLAINVDTGTNSPGFMQPIYYIQQGQGQNSSSDPWKRGVISLEQFVGSIIRLQFIARNNQHNGTPANQNIQNDIALDDLRIFEPVPVEMEVLSTTLPENGYCAYGNDSVNISVRNNGCVTVADVPVAFQVNNGTIQRDTIYNANLGLGEQILNYKLSNTVSFPGPGTYQVKVWTEMTGDADLSNDTAVGPVINYNPDINTFPYIEDFENETPGSQSLSNTDLILESGLSPNLFWEVGNEMTSTLNTGPYSGFYWEGNYLFVNSNGSSGPVSTYLRTLCFNLSGMSNPTLSFLYHDNASDLQNLSIEVSRADENINTWTTVPGSFISTSTTGGNELDDWKLKQVDLSNFASQSSSLKIRFKATRRTGSGDKTNLAIDNITVYDAISQDGGAFSLKNPGKIGIFNLGLTPQVAVANYGTSNLTSYTVNMDVTPLCGNNPQTTSYSQSFNTTIAPGSSQTLTLNSANVNWPSGECEVCVYTTVAGDNNTYNDTICRNVIGIGSFDIPYVENFDSCNYSADGYYPSGANSLLQWELGTPSFGFGAGSPPNSWATNLDGPFIPGTAEYLTVPKLGNFDTIVGAKLHVVHAFNFGSSSSPYNAAGTLEYYNYQNNGYSILGGDRVGLGGGGSAGQGAGTIGEYWYDSQYGDLQIGLFNDKPGWKGSTNGSYIHSIYPMNEFNRDTLPLLLQFRFQSNASASPAAGWAIDTVYVEVPPQNSVSPVAATTVKPLPYPGFNQDILVRFKNTGEKIVNNFDYTITIDGNAVGGTDNYSVPQNRRPFLKDQVVTDTFDFPWQAGSVTPGVHTICVTTSRPNSKKDNRPSDDNNCFQIRILREIDLTSIGDSSFCDDFEGPDSEWKPVYNPNVFEDDPNLLLWEHGTPTQIDTGAHSGTKAWMTNLDGNYFGEDNAGLWSPIFIVDSGQTFELSFWHWFKTEKYHDGGNVEYSFDQGETWQPFGYSIKGKNWFNTAFVTALDKIRGGWTDSSAGWVNSNQTLAFLDDIKVVFRYRFGADYSIEDAGWAIDDFCFEKKSGKPEIYIGEGEYQIPTETLVSELVPNPASDWADLNVHLPSRTAMDVKVYNMMGQLVESRSEEFNDGSHTMKFQTTNWNSGVYIVSLEYNGESVTRKLVVSH